MGLLGIALGHFAAETQDLSALTPFLGAIRQGDLDVVAPLYSV
jgi:hypothetical protein